MEGRSWWYHHSYILDGGWGWEGVLGGISCNIGAAGSVSAVFRAASVYFVKLTEKRRISNGLMSINQSTHHPANPSASIGGPPPVGSQLFPTAPGSTLVVTRCLSVQGSFAQAGSLESGTLSGFLLWCLFWLEVTWPEGIEELPWIWDTCAR